jgi:hypothetical protein
MNGLRLEDLWGDVGLEPVYDLNGPRAISKRLREDWKVVSARRYMDKWEVTNGLR